MLPPVGGDGDAGRRHIPLRLPGAVVVLLGLYGHDVAGRSPVQEELVDGLADVVGLPRAGEEAAEVRLIVGKAEQLDRGFVFRAPGVERVGVTDEHGYRRRRRGDRMDEARELLYVDPWIRRRDRHLPSWRACAAFSAVPNLVGWRGSTVRTSRDPGVTAASTPRHRLWGRRAQVDIQNNGLLLGNRRSPGPMVASRWQTWERPHLYQDHFCGLCMTGLRVDYQDHCRGEDRGHVTPTPLLTLRPTPCGCAPLPPMRP